MILDLLDNKHRGYGTMGKPAKFMSIIILPMSVSDFFISHLLIEGKKNVPWAKIPVWCHSQFQS